MNLKFMKSNFKTYLVVGLVFLSGIAFAQDEEEQPAPAVDSVEEVMEVKATQNADTTKLFQRLKLDGITAVVGDYVILDSDIEKTLIDLRNQGVSTEDVTRCSLLGKLMEDRLYAHQAVQDSILVADDEVNATSERQIQSLLQQTGSWEKLLKFYKKEDQASFRAELFNINKLQMLSQRMQASIVEGIEVTPEEVRQFFNKIPKDELPQFGAELEISQIVKTPKIPEEEKQKVIDKLSLIHI